jgi:HNH endonuclease
MPALSHQHAWWKKRSIAFLRANVLCLCCRAIGRTTKAEVSDHVLPIALGGRWQGELQPACARCHSTVKRELERRFKAGRCAASDLRLDSKMAMELARMQYRTIGIDGFPIA